jgi:hypothetical protein
MLELPNDGIRIVASFDEFNLDVEFRYEGRAYGGSSKCPSEAEIFKTKRRGASHRIFDQKLCRWNSHRLSVWQSVQLYVDHWAFYLPVDDRGSLRDVSQEPGTGKERLYSDHRVQGRLRENLRPSSVFEQKIRAGWGVHLLRKLIIGRHKTMEHGIC